MELGTSLEGQWLRLHHPMQGRRFNPGGGAKIPHASQPKNQKHKNRSNIVTNSMKTFKMAHVKKKKKFKQKTIELISNLFKSAMYIIKC